MHRLGLAPRLMSLLAALALAAGSAAYADDPFHAGYLSVTAAGDPPVPVSVWYPTTVPEVPFRSGPFATINATRDAPIAPGKHRLVVISHGTLGSDIGHRDLAEFLARHGIVVAAPRHLGDSYDRPEGQGTDVQVIGRPWQIVATLDAVLADARLASAIDQARIGMAGFSAGGYTTLVIAGAEPKLERWQAHCAAHPQDLGALCRGSDTVAARTTRPGWQLPHETRVKAAVAMAPFGVVFDAAGLAGINIPLRVYEAKDDHVLVNAWNTDHVLASLPRPAEHATVPGGHYVFLVPCPEAAAKALPHLCVDAPGIDRAAIHRQINPEILDFFDRTLGRD